MGKQPAALRHSRALSLSEKLLRPYAAALVTGPAGRVRQTANRRLTGPWLQSATAELNLRNSRDSGPSTIPSSSSSPSRADDEGPHRCARDHANHT